MAAEKNASYYNRIGDFASLRIILLSAMSVFTRVERDQLEQFLRRYDLAAIREFTPIAAGITNTNYYLDTDDGRFVLTLFEHHSDDELEFILGLQRHLGERGVTCAAPLADRRGGFFSMLNQRPAAVIHRLEGDIVEQPGERHCASVGAELARFHLQGQDFAPRRSNPRGLGWLLAVGDMLEPELDQEQRLLLRQTLEEYQRLDNQQLPSGAIHADLFHDNVLFVDDRLGGFFDFDYACQDSFVFDIAVVLNDWCVDADGDLDPARVTALIEAYRAVRPLSPAEADALPLLLRLAALRFWISRLHDLVYPMSGELTYSKNPAVFHDMLIKRTRGQTEIAKLFIPHHVG